MSGLPRNGFIGNTIVTSPSDEALTTAEESPRRLFTWPRVLLAIVAGLLLAVSLAPAIVAATPLRNWALASVFNRLGGTITAESANFSWFSGVVLEQIHIVDHDGKTVARADRFECNRTFWQLALDPHTLGATITGAELIAEQHGDAALNLASVFGPMAKDDAGGNRVDLRIDVPGAKFSYSDDSLSATAGASEISLLLKTTNETPPRLHVTASGQLKLVEPHIEDISAKPLDYAFDGLVDVDGKRLEMKQAELAFNKDAIKANVTGTLEAADQPR